MEAQKAMVKKFTPFNYTNMQFLLEKKYIFKEILAIPK